MVFDGNYDCHPSYYTYSFLSLSFCFLKHLVCEFLVYTLFNKKRQAFSGLLKVADTKNGAPPEEPHRITHLSPQISER